MNFFQDIKAHYYLILLISLRKIILKLSIKNIYSGPHVILENRISLNLFIFKKVIYSLIIFNAKFDSLNEISVCSSKLIIDILYFSKRVYLKDF